MKQGKRVRQDDPSMNRGRKRQTLSQPHPQVRRRGHTLRYQLQVALSQCMNPVPDICYMPRTASESVICDGLRILQWLSLAGALPPVELVEALLKDGDPWESAWALVLAGELGLGAAGLVLKMAGATLGPWASPGGTILHLAALRGRADVLEMALKQEPGLIHQKDHRNHTALHFAAEKGHTECACLLLGTGADVNITNGFGETPLHVATRKGHVELLRLLLVVANADFNKRNCHLKTPLHLAIEHNRVECLAALLMAKVDVNITDSHYTALHMVAMNGNSEMLKMLLNAQEIDIHKQISGKTAFDIALEYKRIECLHHLVQSKVKPNTSLLSGNCLLQNAVKNRNIEILKILLESKYFDINKETDGETAVDIAVKYNSLKCLRQLVKARADMNKPDNSGDTPIHRVCKYGQSEILEILLKSEDFNVNIQNNLGQTAVLCAAYYNRIECVRLLIEALADVNRADHSGYSPLHRAAEYGFSDVTRMLLMSGRVCVDKRNFTGETALHIALKLKKIACARLLIEAKADVNIADQELRVPLFMTVWSNCIGGIHLLLEFNADVYLRNYKGTILHVCVRFGRAECLQLLLDAALNLESEGNMTRYKGLLEERDNYGYTALHFASNLCRKECIQLLVNAGADLNAETLDGKTAADLCMSGTYGSERIKLLCVKILRKAANKKHRRRK